MIKGFALIELTLLAKIIDGRGSEYEDRRIYIDRELDALKGLLTDTGGPGGPARSPGPAIDRGPHQPLIRWPSATYISKVEAIKRLHGRETYPEFQIYVEIVAESWRQLRDAFHYLEHYCGVEGYGGGG